MGKKLFVSVCAILLLGCLLVGCGKKKDEAAVKLDPNNPVTVTIWHYYNGAQKRAFDALVKEFNESVGKQVGIFVENESKGSVTDLEKAVQDSVNGVVGASAAPNIFSSYPDTALSLQQRDLLVDLTKYFTQAELSEYIESYINEGYIAGTDGLYLFPVAKSTEVMMLNVTAWNVFAKETGSKLEELSTMEGLVQVAERYYNWSGGKAFYGIDSMSNYMIIGMKQMGVEIFAVENGELQLNAPKELIRKLWDNYYVPYIKGYFAAYGRFRSDDVKTGDLIAYTGSSSSAAYFPDVVENENGSTEVECAILPVPVFEGGVSVNVQQGAGMAIIKKNDKLDYASSVFLKWFTEKENNLRFACGSAYLPVLKEANNTEALAAVNEKYNLNIDAKAYKSLSFVMENYSSMKFYSTKSFKNGFSIRSILDNSLVEKASADKKAILSKVEQGQNKKTLINTYCSEEFEKWYNQLINAIQTEKAKE